MEIDEKFLFYTYTCIRICAYLYIYVYHFVIPCFYMTKVRATATEQKIYQRKLEFIVAQRCSI